MRTQPILVGPLSQILIAVLDEPAGEDEIMSEVEESGLKGAPSRC